MSQIKISNATVADPGGKYNGKTLDILIENGVITAMGAKLEASANVVVDVVGHSISAGWGDTLAFCGEPGEEWKEDLESLANAANAGGFTSVNAFCGSHPLPDRAAAINSIIGKSKTLPVNIMPYGMLTKDGNALEMAELYDMWQAGAVGFFNGEIPILDNGLITRIMEYAANFNAPVLLTPFDKSLAPGGSIHEGIVSAGLGLKGIPSISEKNPLVNQLNIAKWLNCPVWFTRISTAESVAAIREAKSQGLKVFASVPVLNLLFTHESLNEFDENFKLMPPLRTENDRTALIEGLLDGTIDAICSNHSPQDTESKLVEFDYAQFGAATIQFAAQALITALGNKCNPELIAKILSHGYAKYLGKSVEHLEVGNALDLTVFHTDIVSKTVINSFSKGVNSPLKGMALKGSVLGTLVKGNWQSHSTAMTGNSN